MSHALKLLTFILTTNVKHDPKRAEDEGKTPEEYIESHIASFMHDVDESLVEQEKRMLEELEEMQERLTSFVDTELPLWQGAFGTAKMLLFLTYALTEHIASEVEDEEDEEDENEGASTSDETQLFYVMYYLNRRICQHFESIIILLEHGCVDSAFTLWRSIYECLCIMAFIHTSKTQEKVAAAYLRYTHEETGSHAWAKVDKRLASAKNASVSFTRIEAVCGIREIWADDDRTPFVHLQAFGLDKGENPEIMPELHNGPTAFEVSDVAILSVNAMMNSLIILSLYHLPQGHELLLFRTLEVWAEKAITLFDEANVTYCERVFKEHREKFLALQNTQEDA